MDGGLREWLAGLGRRELTALAVVGVALAGGAALWYVRSLPRAVSIEPAPAAPVPGPTPSTPPPVFVHVAGWVRSPGVYELTVGERVIDAIEHAGGPRRGADLNALNLAAPLADGEQVLVPRRLAAGASGGGAGVPGGPPSASAGSAGSAAGSLVNINTATPEQLETLPGIGEVLAQRIIDHRDEHGPFGSVDQLLDVSGIGEKRLEDIRDEVTV